MINRFMILALRFLLVIALFSVPLDLFPQCQPFTESFPGQGYDLSESMTIDHLGNTYVVGKYRETITFGSFSLSAPLSSYYFFLAKVDPNGNTVWAKSYPSKIFIRSPQVLWSNGGLFVSLSYRDSVQIDTFNFQAGSQGTGVALARIDANGNAVWAQNMTSPYVAINDLAADDAGNCIVTGQYRGLLNIPGGNPLATTGFQAFWLAKFSPSGSLTWAIGDPGSGSTTQSSGEEVVVDGQGNYLVGGSFRDKVEVDGQTLAYGGGSSDHFFFVQVSPSGNATWLKGGQVQGVNATSLYTGGILLDANGQFFFTGSVSGTVTFNGIIIDGQQGNGFLARFNATGDLQWYRQGGALNTTTGSFSTHYRLPVRRSETDLWVIGVFFAFPVIDGQTYTTVGTSEPKIILYDTSGAVLRVDEFPNTNDTWITDASTDPQGQLEVLGHFTAPVAYLNGDTLINTNSVPNYEVFLARLCDSSIVASADYPSIKPLIFSASPNPSNQHSVIHFNHAFTGDLRLLDLQGRVLWSRTEFNANQGQEIKIDLSGIAKGVYLFQISNGISRETKKIVKM